MNTGVVHDDDRVWSRERVHCVKESINETVEFLGSIWMVLHCEVKDPIEGECGKDGIARGLSAKDGGIVR